MPSPLEALALEIFGEMIEAETAWESALNRRCGADQVLRAEVERLWRDYQSASANDLLNQPALKLLAADKLAHDSGVSDALAVPAIGFGRFQLQRRLGRGGQGEVWLAIDPTLGREVALKIIPPRLVGVEVLIEKLRLEAEITGRLEHPNIVPIYEAGRDSRQFPFYAMRVFRDENLQAAIDRFHQSDRTDSGLRQLLGRFIDVCEAIAYAHSRGIIHRDLKPHNVMLGEFGETLVVDWGMAKIIGQDLRSTDVETAVATPTSQNHSHVGQIKGTPAYMSPEQAWGQAESLGPATDVFSLGAVLFCILTGQAPRNVRSKGSGSPGSPDKSPKLTPDEAIAQARDGIFQRPTLIDPRVPHALEAICKTAMAKEAADRYSTALELAKDVQRWLNDEPVSAWREPLSVRTRRWLRKHQTSAASIVVTTVIALGAIAGVVSSKNQQLFASNRQLDQRNDQLKTAQSQVQLTNQSLEQTNQNLQQRNNEILHERDRLQLALQIAFRLLHGIETGGNWSIDDAYSDILQNGLQLADSQRAAMLPLFEGLLEMQAAVESNRVADHAGEKDLVSQMKQWTVRATAARQVGTALKEFEEALRHHPESGLAWLLKAQIRREVLSHPPADVLPDWNRAVQLLPKSSAAVSGLGWCLYALKRFDDADKALLKAVELDPGNEFAHFGLGEIASVRNDSDCALRHYLRAAELPPRFSTDRVWLMAVKVAASRTSWGRAVDRASKNDWEGAFKDNWLAIQWGQPKDCVLLWANAIELAMKLTTTSAQDALNQVQPATSHFRERPEFEFGRDVLAVVLETQSGGGDPHIWKDLRIRWMAQPTIASELSEKFRSELREWSKSDRVSKPMREAVHEFLDTLNPTAR